MQRETDNYTETVIKYWQTGSPATFWPRIPDSFCVQDGPALSLWTWEGGNNKELQGHKKWSWGSGSWMLSRNTEFCAVFVRELLWDASSVLGNDWTLSTQTFSLCPSPEPNCCGTDLGHGKSCRWWCLTVRYTKLSHTLTA